MVVLGADTKKIRTLDTVKVLNYIYNNFKKIDIENIIYENFDNFKNFLPNNIYVEKSIDKPIMKLETPKQTIFPIKKDELNSISSEVYHLQKIKSPTSLNQKIGEITIKLNNEILVSSNILLDNILHRKTWKWYYKELLQFF